MAKKSTVVTVTAGGGYRHLFWLNAALLSLILLSAFGVILSTHNCREVYAKLQVLEASQWYLQEDYGRLLLEQSTWASHYRVEQVARRDLGMHAPAAASQRVVIQ
ncbi:MAG: cell division protein FtsL [Halioglobus sp.]